MFKSESHTKPCQERNASVSQRYKLCLSEFGYHGYQKSATLQTKKMTLP